MRLVLFDIDGTLVPGASSEARFARYLRCAGALGLRQILAYAWFCVRYFPRHGRHVLEKNKAYLSGHSRTDIRNHARAFIADTLMPELNASVLERLRAHQAAGDTVALLSGTPDFIAEALADALGVRYSLAALCAVQNERFTAKPPLRHPYAATKIDAAFELARRAGLALSQAIAYGDSINDAYLFRVVGEVVVVQPDRRLSATAGDAGWQVMPNR